MTTANTTARPEPPTVRHDQPLGILTRFRRSPEALRGAVILFAATFAALMWANLPGTSYEIFWHLPLGVEFGDFSFDLDLQHWVNDALMAVFFAHVTLEVRRELELGELRDWRRASVPIIAAIAGLIVPALIYVGITAGTGAVGGWGVVVSTDTAFVLGMLALAGRGMPAALRIFVVTLAVSDDVGALGVIAFAYTDDFNPLPLLLAAAGLAVIGVMRYLGVWRGPLYLLPSVVVWIGFLLSGVHATLAGVAIALLLPIFSTRADDLRRAQSQMRAFQMTPTAISARSAENSLARAVSINERAYNALTPYVTWFILPVFALSNAGVRLTLDSLVDAFTSQLTWGIIIGLVAGKTVAITLSTWIVTRFRRNALGPYIGMPHIIGVSLLAGMGFTISLFVTELAFDDPVDVSRAQIGVLAATVLAAILGAVAFAILGARERHRSPAPGRLLRPLDPARDHILGDAGSALVSVVEYGNYATPYAARAGEMRREMQSRFGHEVAYAFRHLPLDQSMGRAAALANEAATRQGRFWEMRDELIREAPIQTERQILRAAAAAGLNLRRFELDWVSAAAAERVDQDVQDGESMHLTQAPSFFVAGELYRDSIDADSVNTAVRAARDSTVRRNATAEMESNSES